LPSAITTSVASRLPYRFSISAEAMWAYEDGSLVISSLVSTGIGPKV